MRKRLFKLMRRECRHTRSVVANSAGVRRRVCQACGNISFEMTRPPAARRQIPLDDAVGL